MLLPFLLLDLFDLLPPLLIISCWRICFSTFRFPLLTQLRVVQVSAECPFLGTASHSKPLVTNTRNQIVSLRASIADKKKLMVFRRERRVYHSLLIGRYLLYLREKSLEVPESSSSSTVRSARKSSGGSIIGVFSHSQRTERDSERVEGETGGARKEALCFRGWVT